jgi:ribose transport system permease protein
VERTAVTEIKKNPSGISAKMIGDLAPYIGFVLVTVIFTALTKGSLLSANNLQSLSNQIIVTALVTLGAVFVFGAGFFDMSMGGTICFAAVMGGVTAVSTGNLFLAALVIFAVSLIFGVAKGLFAAYINIPFFIFTIVLGSVISAVVLVILGSKTNMNLSDAVRPIPELTFTQMSIVNVVCLILFFLLCLVLFNYTSLGLRIRNMGGNMTAARQSGISTKKTAIEAFLVSSLGVAVAAFIILIRTRSVSGSTAGSVGTDVMVALVLGGMPLSGGPRSKISAGIIGAATITILNSGLTILGLTTGQIQICRGIVFIVVVFVSSFSYRSRLLPR